MIPLGVSLIWMLIGLLQTSLLVFGLLGLILLWRRVPEWWNA